MVGKELVKTPAAKDPEEEGVKLMQPASDERQPSITQKRRNNLRETASASPDSFRMGRSITNPFKRKIFVSGGDTSYEVFDWSTQQWTLYEDKLFFSHGDAFSFVYDNSIMICSGTGTNRVDCVDVASNSSCVYPSLLPNDCGKGVLCGDKILTFKQSVSATSLKPPFKTTVLNNYVKGKTRSSYGVAFVNENVVAIVGGLMMSDVVLLYNLTTKCFTKLAPLPKGLLNVAVVVHKDNLIILGGYDVSFTPISQVFMYNMTSQTCRKLPCMLEER